MQIFFFKLFCHMNDERFGRELLCFVSSPVIHPQSLQ